MKAALFLTLALALFAPALRAQTELEEESSDSVALGDGGGAGQRTGQTTRACTNQEYVTASFHCDDHHAPTWMNCRITSCIVRNNWIVYTWNGYYFGV